MLDAHARTAVRNRAPVRASGRSGSREPARCSLDKSLSRSGTGGEIPPLARFHARTMSTNNCMVTSQWAVLVLLMASNPRDAGWLPQRGARRRPAPSLAFGATAAPAAYSQKRAGIVRGGHSTGGPSLAVSTTGVRGCPRSDDVGHERVHRFNELVERADKVSFFPSALPVAHGEPIGVGAEAAQANAVVNNRRLVWLVPLFPRQDQVGTPGAHDETSHRGPLADQGPQAIGRECDVRLHGGEYAVGVETLQQGGNLAAADSPSTST